MDVRKTEIYKRVVTDKIVHFLNEILIENSVLSASELVLRLDQVRKLLRPVDFDDVAINRASMGFCGWPGCDKQAPDKRCLELLYMIWKNSMDEDVVDSFHSVDCFELFMRVRKTLDPTVSQLRSIPDDLAEEFIDKRLASSNVNVLLKKADISTLLKPAAAAAEPPKKDRALKKHVSFIDDPHVASHPAKRTDVAASQSGADSVIPEWKNIPKSVAITMSQTTSNDLFKFDYDAPPKVVDKLRPKLKQEPPQSDDESTELEFFTSMNDLLNCSFESRSDDDDGDDDDFRP